MVSKSVLDKISVLNDKILLAPSTPKTQSGIIIPDGVNSDDVVKCGYVIKKGKGHPMVRNLGDESKEWEKKTVAIQTDFIPLSVNIGDFVYFLDQRSIGIRHEGYNFVVISESSIMMVVKMDDPVDELEKLLSKVDG